jgi:hypothetical protein
MPVYEPGSLGIKPPSGGFQQGGWYGGRQYWNGTLSDPGVIHEASNQQGAGQVVSAEVNRQSDQAQGNKPGDIEKYLQAQRDAQAKAQPTVINRPSGAGMSTGVGASAGAGSGVGLAGAGLQQAQLNLPELYKSLTEGSGVQELENNYTQMNQEYIDAKNKINDNPFLSEATRVGRVAKIESLFAERTKDIRDQIATKKADVETKLNLEMKQFDINSQQTKMAWDQLNTLLANGALQNASGEDIATLTRATGIGSSMIYSMIDANKKGVDTQVIQSENDNGEVTISVIDKQTGEVISQNSLGAVGTKTKSSSGGSASSIKSSNIQAIDSGLSSQTNPYGHVPPAVWNEALKAYVQDGLGNAKDFNLIYGYLKDPNRTDSGTSTGYIEVE